MGVGEDYRKLLLGKILGWNKIGDAIRMLLIESDKGIEKFSEIVWVQISPITRIIHFKRNWKRDIESIHYEEKSIRIIGEGVTLFEY